MIALVFLGLWARSACWRARRPTRCAARRACSRSTRPRWRSPTTRSSAARSTRSRASTPPSRRRTPTPPATPRRVRRLALALGNELERSKDKLDALRLGGLFHDIGKIAIPDAILLKPGRLTEDEYERMKDHSAEGARIVGKPASSARSSRQSATTTSAGTGAATRRARRPGHPPCSPRSSASPTPGTP